MPTKRIKQLIMDLPMEHKIVGGGSILMAISLLLPWYQDLDSFHTGDMFLGLTGPLYLLGFSILAMSLVNIAFIVFNALEKKLPVNIRPASFFMVSGIVSFFLLIVANSVYFHPKFGVNITLKESQFGMFIAFIAASLLTVGGYFALRDKQALLKEFQEQAQEPLIKIPEPMEIRKPKENLRNMNNQATIQTFKPEEVKKDMVRPAGTIKTSIPTPVEPIQPVQKKSSSMDMLARAAAQISMENGAKKIRMVNQLNTVASAGSAQAAQQPVPVQKDQEAMPKKAPQPYRMDL